MRYVGSNAITVAGVIGLLWALVAPNTRLEPLRSAESHDCCASLPASRAADDECGSSPGNAAPRRERSLPHSRLTSPLFAMMPR
jgi:hypothetical protein